MELDAIGFGASPHAAQASARWAQGAGLGALWLTESSAPAWALCTAAALAAPDYPIGTGVAVAFARSPMLTAQAAWMLQQLTGGKFLLGLGTQVRAHVERRYAMAFEPPGPRMREYVAALRAIFAAFAGREKLSFSGDYWSFNLLTPEWSPGPIDHADPTIYVAGVRPYMCSLIGEVADGMHVHPLHGMQYLHDVVLPNLAKGAAKAGRDPKDIVLACPVMTAVSDDEDDRRRQREEIRFRLGFYGSTPGYGVVFDAHGWPGTGDALRAAMKAGDMKEIGRIVTDDMIDAYAVTSDWNGLAAKLHERYRGLNARVISYSAGPQVEKAPQLAENWAGVAAQLRALG